MKGQSDIKGEPWEQRGNNFKKKGGRSKNRKQQSAADEFFRGDGFSVSTDGPEMYLKRVEELGLYICMFKNGSDVRNIFCMRR